MTSPLTDQQLNELDSLAKNIPAGPWTVDDSRAELRGSHGNLLADLWDDRLGAYFAAMHAATPALLAYVRRLRDALAREERLHGDTIDDRDRATDMADKLAYAVASEDVIGEHTADNSPWANALELITPAAEVERLRAELATANARLNATARLAGRQETKLRELGVPSTVDVTTVHAAQAAVETGE